MRQNQMTKAVRRGVAALAVAALAVTGLAAAPVSADAPAEFTIVQVFEDVTNPCTGAETDLTRVLEIREHQGHSNNVTGTAHVTGTTTDGYSNNGIEHININKDGILRNTVNETWSHEDGSKFRLHASALVDLNTGELLSEKARITCLGNN